VLAWCLVLWLDLFVSLWWLLVYCGSYVHNNISCLVGFFFCTSHLLVIFLPLYRIKWRTSEEEMEALTNANKQMLLPASPFKVSKLKKTRHHSTFFFLLMLSFIPPSSLWWRPRWPRQDEEWRFHTSRQKRMTTYLPQSQCSCLSPSPLSLLSSNLGTRFCLRG
jgi:hypothetical protein